MPSVRGNSSATALMNLSLGTPIVS